MKIQYDLERVNRENFRSCLEALARPGEMQTLIPLFDSDILAMASVLLYAEVSHFYEGTHDFGLIRAMCGSQQVGMADADYLFADRPDPDYLDKVRVGTAESPELGATLLFCCNGFPEKTRVVLSGPGIKEKREVDLPLSPEFINRLKVTNQAFPMGVDLFLIADDQLMGLPRTTRIEVVA